MQKKFLFALICPSFVIELRSWCRSYARRRHRLIKLQDKMPEYWFDNAMPLSLEIQPVELEFQ